MANKLQLKRTSVSGRTPNTTNSGNTWFIDTGELAINLPDGKMFSSNGTVLIEVGANLSSISISSAMFTVNSSIIGINSNDVLRYNDGTTQNTAYRVYDSSGTRIA